MASPDSKPIKFTHQYSSESELNTVDICLPRGPSRDNGKRYWVVFIHGGAWLDPDTDSSSFAVTQDHLLAGRHRDLIEGYASINYRLSPFPSHPTNPSHPADPARNAKHPDHITDVLRAVLYLQETYHFGDRYILAGHSAGATLSFQLAMKRYWGQQYEPTYALELNVVPPIAIAGLAGIYDLHALVRNHADKPEYHDFVAGAFGPPAEWDKASPSHGAYASSWEEGQLAVIAHSAGDTLLEEEQAQIQLDTLRKSGWSEGRALHDLELHGDHDEMWKGSEAARAIDFTIQQLVSR